MNTYDSTRAFTSPIQDSVGDLLLRVATAFGGGLAITALFATLFGH